MIVRYSITMKISSVPLYEYNRSTGGGHSKLCNKFDAKATHKIYRCTILACSYHSTQVWRSGSYRPPQQLYCNLFSAHTSIGRFSAESPCHRVHRPIVAVVSKSAWLSSPLNPYAEYAVLTVRQMGQWHGGGFPMMRICIESILSVQQ